MSELDDYIAANQDRYTREAITDQLLAAGHPREAIDAAWKRSRGGARGSDRGWRPGWITFAGLVILGSIGAWFVWADERYGGGGFAVVAYVVIVAVAFALAKGLAMVADRGGGGVVAVGVVLALGAAAGAWFSFITPGLELLALAFAVLGGVPAVLLIIRPSDQRVTGTVAAALPLIVWVAVTGTCYAPLYPKLVP